REFDRPRLNRLVAWRVPGLVEPNAGNAPFFGRPWPKNPRKGIQMRKRLLMLGAALAAGVTAGPVGATTLTVHDLGTVINDGRTFTPVNISPGMNTDIFEFELPTTQFVSASPSISGPVSDQLTGTFNLNDWTSTGT